MGFEFDSLLPQKKKKTIPISPSDSIRDYYEEKIASLRVLPILKRYLSQILNEILAENSNFDKGFLFDLRETLQKIPKHYDEKDYFDFLEILDELFKISVDKEISYKSKKEEGPRTTNNENQYSNLFARLVQRHTINHLFLLTRTE